MTATIKPIQRSHRSQSTHTSLQNVGAGLGAIVSWSFNGRSWTPDEIRNACDNWNMDWLIPAVKDVPVTNGMHNAVSLFRDVSENEEPIKADKVHADIDAGLYTFAILEREGDTKAKRSRYDTIDKITYDTKTKSFLASGNTKHSDKLCQSIQFRVEHYTGNEFRKWVIMPCLTRWKAIRVMGGCYYVTEKHIQELDQLEALCDSLGVTFRVLDQLNTARTASNIGREGKQSLKDRIDEVKNQLDGWKGRKRIRKDGSDKLLLELKDILDTGKMLKDALDVSVDDIQLAIKEATQEALAIIDGQSTKPVTSKKVLKLWSDAMKPEYCIGDDIYMIPFDDLESLYLPSTAKKGTYYKPGQRLARALLELGYVGQIKKTQIILTPIQ